uniref:Uncharacterized protein n=1 Tax=Timema monikensis TaxID=170555 RepID=A0A7R9HRX6_9NEOP|nr:unnamed protein product [Timema monikensis]
MPDYVTSSAQQSPETQVKKGRTFHSFPPLESSRSAPGVPSGQHMHHVPIPLSLSILLCILLDPSLGSCHDFLELYIDMFRLYCYPLYHRLQHRCHRQGSYIDSVGEQRKRQIKRQGSNKMGSACPSYIEMTEDGNSIYVVYYKGHYGHNCTFRRLPLSKEDRIRIADLIESGVSLPHILTNIRENATEDNFSRLQLTNRRDLHNIRRQFSLGKERNHIIDESLVIKEHQGRDVLLDNESQQVSDSCHDSERPQMRDVLLDNESQQVSDYCHDSERPQMSDACLDREKIQDSDACLDRERKQVSDTCPDMLACGRAVAKEMASCMPSAPSQSATRREMLGQRPLP